MLLSEEELTIKVTEVNRIKIDNVNFAKACKRKVLE